MRSSVPSLKNPTFHGKNSRTSRGTRSSGHNILHLANEFKYSRVVLIVSDNVQHKRLTSITLTHTKKKKKSHRETSQTEVSNCRAGLITGGHVTVIRTHDGHKNNTVFAENLVRLGFLQSVSYIKPILTLQKLLAVGKSGPNATFNLFFLGWVGLGLGSSTVS